MQHVRQHLFSRKRNVILHTSHCHKFSIVCMVAVEKNDLFCYSLCIGNSICHIPRSSRQHMIYSLYRQTFTVSRIDLFMSECRIYLKSSLSFSHECIIEDLFTKVLCTTRFTSQDSCLFSRICIFSEVVVLRGRYYRYESI